MNEYQVEVSKIIDAPASHLYAIVADYNDGHQAILPKSYFTKMDVLEGGVGEGIIFLLNECSTNVKISEKLSNVNNKKREGTLQSATSLF